MLRYVPDEIRKEFINIGLVLHSPEDTYVDIKFTTNFSRVLAFDDEVDIKFLKIVLDGVKDSFTSLKLSKGRPSEEDLRKSEFLNCATAFYSNQLQFSPIYTIRSTNISEDFDDLFKTYVYFDIHKAERITIEKVKSIMNRVIKEKSVKVKRDTSFNIGAEKIKLDYQYEAKDSHKLIKMFSFDYQNKNHVYPEPKLAKEWTWNFSRIKQISNNCFEKSNKGLNIVTLVYVGEKTEGVKIALDILKTESNEVVQVNDAESIEQFANRITNEVVSV
ncbi:MAG: DUF3037 domain-containing protein [Clostridia bacterium]|nr:DUF3037 domain-containing protein [Clostridia bacterium]